MGQCESELGRVATHERGIEPPKPHISDRIDPSCGSGRTLLKRTVPRGAVTPDGTAEYGDRRLAAGVIKEYPDGRREEVAFEAQGDERVLQTLPPLLREPA